MPRKDPRFTGDDLKRLYCKNLSPSERKIFDVLTCDWDDYSFEEKAEKIFDSLLDAAGDVVQYLPYGHYISLALDGIQLLLDGDVGDTIWLPLPKPQLPAP